MLTSNRRLPVIVCPPTGTTDLPRIVEHSGRQRRDAHSGHVEIAALRCHRRDDIQCVRGRDVLQERPKSPIDLDPRAVHIGLVQLVEAGVDEPGVIVISPFSRKGIYLDPRA